VGSLVECGLANAVIAAALALVALLAGRFSRRPALVHALWALVLVKLLTPPIIPLPVLAPLPEPRAEQAAPAEEPTPSTPMPRVELAVARPQPEPELPPPMPPGMKIEELIPELMKIARGEAPMRPLLMPPLPEAQPPAAITREAPPTQAAPTLAPAVVPKPAPRPAPAPPKGPRWQDVAAFLGTVWLAGAALCLLTALWRVLCFQRLLRHARPAPEGLQRQARELAAQLGLARCPAVLLLPGPVPPLLWAVAGRARLFFPANLLPRLDEAGRAALLAHELAHLARRDHWVRWLELLAGCVYWWYPVVWLARGRLQAAEEECCDAWVVAALPGHGPAYAGALLETVEFLSRRPVPLPPAASGFGRVHQLKRRLTMIVQGSTPRHLSLAGKLLVLALAVALPLTPSRARPAAGPPAKKSDDKSAAKPAKAQRKTAAEPAPEAMPDEPDRYANNSRPLMGSGGQVWQVAISPDGKTLAVVQGGTTEEGALTLWNLESGKEKVTLSEPKPIRCVAFSPDGKHLATGDFDQNVKLRDPKTGAVRKALTGHTGGVNGVAFTPDSKTLISGGLDKTVRYWEVSSGKSTRTLSDHADWVLSVAVSADGKTLIAGSKDTNGYVYDLKSGKRRHVLKGHTNWVETCAISPDNDTVATGSPDGTIRIWSAKTGKIVSTVLAHSSSVNAVTFFDGGKSLATASHDMSVKIWEVESRNETATLANAHTGLIYTVAVSKDGKTLVTGSWDRTVKVWDAQTHEEQKKLQPKRYSPENNFPILALAVSPDGATLAVGGEEKVVKLIDAATGRIKYLLEGHDDMVGGVAFSPNGKLVATAGFDGDVRLWSAETGKPVRTMKGHVNWVFCVAFSPDGKQLASGGYDKTVRIWDVDKGKEITKLNKHKGGVRAIAYTRDGTTLASAGTDKLIRVWDLSKKETAHLLRGHEDVVRSISFSPDGKRIVSGSEDMTIRLWVVAEEKQLASQNLGTAVRSVAWSPRGASVAVGLMDRSLRVMGPKALDNRMTSYAHTNAVTGVAFTADSAKLYTASEDNSVRVWDGQVPSKRPVASYTGAGLMKFARFSPNGKWLAIGGEDKTVEVRNADFGRLRASVTGLGESGYQVAVSPDGKTLAVGCLDKNIRLFTVEGLKPKGTLSGHTERVWSVAFSPDGKKLISGAGSWTSPEDPGEVKIWDLSGKEPKEEASLKGMSASVQAVAWSRDGKHLAVGSRDGLARIFDAETRKELHLLKGHEGEVRSVSFSYDSKHLGTASGDGTVGVWVVESGKKVTQLAAHIKGQGTNSVAWSRDGKWIASVSNRTTPGEVFLWSVSADEEGALSFGKKKVLKGFTARTLTVDFSPDSKTLIAGGGATATSGEVYLYDVASGRQLAALQGPTNWVEGVAFTPDGKTAIAAGGSNNRPGELHAWNVERRGWAVKDAHERGIFAAVWSPKGDQLITGGYDGAIKFWGAATGEEKAKFTAEQGGVRALAVSKDGKWLASGGHDGTVKLWDLSDDKDATELAKFDKVVNSVAFSPDSKLLAACCADPYNRDKRGAVKVIDIETGREKAGDWKARAAMGVAFSPDGKTLATGSLESPGIVLYNVADGKQARVVRGPGGTFAVEYSKDGNLLASAHFNGNVEVHNTKTWGPPVVCAGNAAMCPALGLAPDGRSLASASHDKTVKVFDLRKTARPPVTAMAPPAVAP